MHHDPELVIGLAFHEDIGLHDRFVMAPVPCAQFDRLHQACLGQVLPHALLDLGGDFDGLAGQRPGEQGGQQEKAHRSMVQTSTGAAKVRASPRYVNELPDILAAGMPGEGNIRLPGMVPVNGARMPSRGCRGGRPAGRMPRVSGVAGQ